MKAAVVWSYVVMFAALAVLLPYCVSLSRRLSAAEATEKKLAHEINLLQKDLAYQKGFDAVSSDDFAAMRKEATEHEKKIDAARKISDDAIAECWNEGNVAVDGLDTFIGGRVICMKPYNVVFVAEPHWPEDD